MAQIAQTDAPGPGSFDLSSFSSSSASSSPPPPVLLLALSGPSSSGKTTLARLLRDILPHAYILHLDDFYKHDSEIPVNGAGVQDWDCLGAIDVPALRRTLAHIRAHGEPPADYVSKEDKNAVGDCGIDDAAIAACRARVEALFARARVREKWGARRIAIIDGFLLYSQEMAELGIRDQFDIKLFLRTSYQTAKRRREARTGYVTLEGFWEDPPGYVDDIVWPNYVKDHKFLFKGGDVEGELDEEVCKQIGVQAMPKDAAEDMGKVLEWATSVIVDELAKATQA
ncbi:P-loop containing nucleoside triphosphate hydrolase protein [Macrophomina phaseolina]|uniref:P-loop containing nucleoside triphosphate hydrolase protein n=1 Tax=Macrophomina phaseolina TaxID=35725 RepID=A0ABQ8GXN6_9PEZI|nr:P-loop containing nucleoside triphosphate hydrolase protein [Macrophomina phaseolina]